MRKVYGWEVVFGNELKEKQRKLRVKKSLIEYSAEEISELKNRLIAILDSRHINKILSMDRSRNVVLSDQKISEAFIGGKFQVYDGHKFKEINVDKNMLGFKFGEFLATRKMPKHTYDYISLISKSNFIYGNKNIKREKTLKELKYEFLLNNTGKSKKWEL